MYPKYLKYRAKSIRLPNYDYSKCGAYYITICTHNRECIFGKIKNNRVILNKMGEVANDYWKEIPIYFPFIKLGRFGIMPNHIHSVLVIRDVDFFCRDTACRVSTKLPAGGSKESFGRPTKNSIPTILRSYKAAVTRILRIEHSISDFIVWQRGYYEHIIENEKEYWAIENYIKLNPKNWKDDDFYKS
jgi:putative transposase